MRYKLVTDPQQLELFSNRFKALAGVNLPLEYYLGCRVVAAYDKDETMIGGWVLRLVPPYRSFNLIPPDSSSSQDFLEKAGHDNIVELNGVWIDSKVSTTRETFAFWRAVLKDTVGTNKQYIILGYPQTKEGLHRFYQRLNPGTIFHGTTTTGIPARVAFLTPLKIRMFYIKQAPWLIKRHFNIIKRSRRSA